MTEAHWAARDKEIKAELASHWAAGLTEADESDETYACVKLIVAVATAKTRADFVMPPGCTQRTAYGERYCAPCTAKSEAAIAVRVKAQMRAQREARTAQAGAPPPPQDHG